MQYKFRSAKELLKHVEENNFQGIPDVVIRYEESLTGRTEDEIRKNLENRFKLMVAAIENGMKSKEDSLSGLSGKDTYKIKENIDNDDMLLAPWQRKAMMYAFATMENNARMGCIVACPTAGAAGIVPAALLAVKEHLDLDMHAITDAMLTASALGILIGENACLSGAAGGCQAEVGSATAMATAALCQVRGLSAEACLHSSALALKSLLGLVCDPVGGLVEVPCVKRNVSGTMLAVTCSDMVACGVRSKIPLDEVIAAMHHIGQNLPVQLRETGLGGLAATPTGQKLGSKFMDRDSAIKQCCGVK